jgi:hypothetical protein
VQSEKRNPYRLPQLYFKDIQIKGDLKNGKITKKKKRDCGFIQSISKSNPEQKRRCKNCKGEV